MSNTTPALPILQKTRTGITIRSSHAVVVDGYTIPASSADEALGIVSCYAARGIEGQAFQTLYKARRAVTS